MICSMRIVMIQSHKGNSPFSPNAITSKMHCEHVMDVVEYQLKCLLVIAKHLRKGRQEDSHEFLRYAIDALQKSCLAEFSQYAMNPTSVSQ